MADPFEHGVELRLGENARPTPQDCANAAWGVAASYHAVTDPVGATTSWRTLYLLNNATREVVDVAPLTDEVGSHRYKVSGRNQRTVQAIALFIADRTGGAVE